MCKTNYKSEKIEKKKIRKQEKKKKKKDGMKTFQNFSTHVLHQRPLFALYIFRNFCEPHSSGFFDNDS